MKKSVFIMYLFGILLSLFTFVVRDENPATALSFTFIAQHCLNTHQELNEEEKPVWLLMAVGQSIVLAHFQNKHRSGTNRPPEYPVLKEKHCFWACRVTSEIKDSITGWKKPIQNVFIYMQNW